MERTPDNYNFIYKHGTDIRVHGNGFIQLDLPDSQRINVWGHYDIPRQTVPSQIHDHTFSFDSVVLAGMMVNVCFSPTEVTDHDHLNALGNVYDVYSPTVRQGEDTVLNDTGERVLVYEDGVDVVPEGGMYAMDPGILHGTFVNTPTITLITRRKEPGYTRPARVLLPRGYKPDNVFNRYSMPAEQLWDIVHDVWMNTPR